MLFFMVVILSSVGFRTLGCIYIVTYPLFRINPQYMAALVRSSGGALIYAGETFFLILQASKKTFDIKISKVLCVIWVMVRCVGFLFCQFFEFGVKFRKTKQIAVALVATTRKALLSVAKTNIRLSGRKLYAGNINDLSWNILAHNIPPVSKKVRPKRNAPKKCFPFVCRHTTALPTKV
jgi:hypothetical protein